MVLLPLLVAKGPRPVGLEEVVRQSRTVPLSPQAEPPTWMDYERARAGCEFLAAHRATVLRTLVGPSLASTFAAKDVTPVLVATTRLDKAFTSRMMETGMWMGTIYRVPTSREAFLSRNYARAVALGQLHQSVAEAVKGPLAWDPRVRVPMSGQAYAFVLYSFAWWPIEAMLATHEIDAANDAKGIGDWFHFWSVAGYGMGVPEALLPRDLATAQRTVALLRRAQYAAPGEPRPAGIPGLIGGDVRMLAALFPGKTPPAKDEAHVPVGKPEPEARTLAAAKALADGIALSPGLAEALGLGPDPVARLAEYAALPAAKG